MSETSARKSGKHVGQVLDIAEAVTVTWPDGFTHVVTGGQIVLDRSGEWVVDGKAVTVEP